jgi:hypothetical protein
VSVGYNKFELGEKVLVRKGSLIGVYLVENIIPIETNGENSRSDYFVTSENGIKKINTLTNSRFLANALIDYSFFKKEFIVPLKYNSNESMVSISAYFDGSDIEKSRSYQISNSRQNLLKNRLFLILMFFFNSDRHLDINCWNNKKTFEKEVYCSILVVAQNKNNSIEIDFGNGNKSIENVYGRSFNIYLHYKNYFLLHKNI